MMKDRKLFFTEESNLQKEQELIQAKIIKWMLRPLGRSATVK